MQLSIEAWKSQDFKGARIRDLAIPVRRCNQLSYKATDVRSWSCVRPVAKRDNLYTIQFKVLSRGKLVVKESGHLAPQSEKDSGKRKSWDENPYRW